MDLPCCLVFVNQNALRVKLNTFFRAKKIDCYLVKQGDQLTQLVKNWTPFMMLIDLSAPGSEWLYKHIAEIQIARPGFPMVAVIPEAEEALRQRLETYGCRFVFTEDELLRKLSEAVELILTKQV